MSFVREAWYCASFAEDVLAGSPYRITLLDEPVVLHRDGDGQCRARADAGDRRYPVLERHGGVWVWMGPPAAASAERLPDFSAVEARPGWTRVQGSLHVRAHYQLVTDNLLDLTHVPFLHPFLFSRDVPLPPEYRRVERLEAQGDTVLAINEKHHAPISGLHRLLWEGEAPVYVDIRANMVWHAPSLLLLDAGATSVGGRREDGTSIPTAHWLTPETEATTHYFWVQARNRHVGEEAVSQQIAAGIGNAFAQEDEPMIEACQRNMGTTDLMSLNPVLLPTDAAAIRARRLLSQRLRSELAAEPVRRSV